MDDGDRALREMQLDNLPASTAAAVSELSSYDWQSREAREAYEQIKDLLGRELLDQRFAGMKQALENATDEDRAAVKEMLATSTTCSRRTLGARTPTRSSTSSWTSTATSSPRTRRTSTSCSTRSPQRAAAAQRMLNSMTPEQRAELMQLVAAGVRLARS